MKLFAPAVLALLLAGCAEPDRKVTAIVGAKLMNGAKAAPLERSVVIIEGDRFRAAGPQMSTPIPKEAEIVDGSGKLIVPFEDGAIAPGKPANFALYALTQDGKNGEMVRTMRNGDWTGR